MESALRIRSVISRGKDMRVVSYVIKSKGEERLFVCNGKERILLRRLAKTLQRRTGTFLRCFAVIVWLLMDWLSGSVF